MPSEFALIRRHFTRPARHTDLAVGDDAALIRPSAGMQLAISTDMLVAGTHFFADTDPENLGWKTLAVNVSDLAAMGAQPRWVVLAASLPAPDEAWIAAFARGFFACSEAFGIDVIALFVAFHVNFRHARAFERIVVTPLEVFLRKVSHHGRETIWRFNPIWTRLERQNDEDYGLLGLKLVSRGQSVAVASALSPHERAGFADALGSALSSARRGPDYGAP